MSQSQVMKQALIIGASSAIAKALIEDLEQQQVEVTSVSRSSLERSPHYLVDYDDEAITEWVKELNGQQFDYIYICNGVLHGQGVAPEKSLSAFNEQQFNEVIRANTLVPMLWLKHTPVLVPRNEPSVITIFSARVGSISDNRLGGWYSYRASQGGAKYVSENRLCGGAPPTNKQNLCCFILAPQTRHCLNLFKKMFLSTNCLRLRLLLSGCAN